MADTTEVIAAIDNANEQATATVAEATVVSAEAAVVLAETQAALVVAEAATIIAENTREVENIERGVEWLVVEVEALREHRNLSETRHLEILANQETIRRELEAIMLSLAASPLSTLPLLEETPGALPPIVEVLPASVKSADESPAPATPAVSRPPKRLRFL